MGTAACCSRLATHVLYEALHRLYAAPELRRKLGMRAREAVQKSYWLETNLDQLADCFYDMKGAFHHV